MAMSMVLESGGMALHRQLFLVLRDQIVRRALPSGSALPTEAALCEQYGVSRITVRRALQDLADEGYVERRHGVGTFVLEQRGLPEATPATVMDGLRKIQLETSVDVVTVDVRPAPDSVRAALQLEAGEDVLYVLRVRRDKADREPLMVSEVWLPARFAQTVTAKALKRTAMFELLAAAGASMGRVVQEITAEMADPQKAQMLETSIGAALIRLNRYVFDRSGTPLQVQSLYLSPLRSRILTDIPAEHLDTVTTGVMTHDLPRPPRSKR